VPVPLLAALLALALTPSGAAAADAVRVRETRSISVGEPPAAGAATHDLALHVYMFQDTRWRSTDVARALREAARTLAQCGVQMTDVELRLLEAPRRFHDYFTPVSRELLRTIAAPKPAIFLVEETRNEPAFDAEAIGRGNATTRPELADTVWVAYGARDLGLVLAHELVHVLSDSGEHSHEAGNLMLPETAPANTRLSVAQCRRLRARGEANGLLTRHSK